MNYTDKQIEALIKGIEDGSITELDLPVGYYNALTDYLKKAVFEGFGSTLETVSKLDLPLLEELVTNVYTFGAAKTFQLTKEISGLLVDENGKVRSSREFNRIARETYDNWNNNWGRTEYNTAIGQADMAAKWREIEKQKDILPFLKYDAVVDKNTSDICRPLDGIVAPVGDKIWSKIMPLNHFNCRCVVLQVAGGETKNNDKPVEAVTGMMQPMFINNAGQSGQIFTKDHPYYDVAKEYRDYAKKNFNLPIPKMGAE